MYVKIILLIMYLIIMSSVHFYYCFVFFKNSLKLIFYIRIDEIISKQIKKEKAFIIS